MKKKLIRSVAVVMVLLLLVPLTAVAESGFPDVPQWHWAYSYISRAAAEDLVNGTGDGTFLPESEVSYAEWTTMVTRLCYPEEFGIFMSANPWWLPYALVGIQHGLLKDVAFENAKGSFNGIVADQPINRFEMAQMVYNLVADLEDIESIDVTEPALADYDMMSDAQKRNVAICVSLGFITGTDKGVFDGEANMSRAQAATVLCRLSDYRNGTPTPTPTPPVSSMAMLANGLPLTEENVHAALMALKEEARFAEGAPWSTGETYLYLSPAFGPGSGCNSYAYLLSDTIFGENAPLRTHTNYSEIRVGDVLWFSKGLATTTEHVAVVTAIDGELYETCDGNVDGKVSWSGWGRISSLASTNNTIVYTRYPE